LKCVRLPQNLSKVLFLLFFIFLLNTGVFYFYYQEFRSNNIAAAQSATSGTVNDTNTNTTNNSFNETSSTFVVNDIVPRTITLNPTQNISETAELRIPEIEVRQKFMEAEKREEALEEINPSPEENIQEQQVDLGSNETTSSTIMPPTSDSDSNHQLNSSFRGSNEVSNTLSSTNTTLTSLVLPSGFRIYHDSDLSGTVPHIAQFFRNEPVAAKAENTVFYVGTFYAANSSDSGRTWSYVDLLTQMPITCCDSDLAYDDRNGVFLWSMMNLPYRGSSPELGEVNNITLGVSVDTSLWRLYDIGPETLNASWTNNVLDYPQLFMSEKYVYISANRFTNWSSTDPRGNIFEGPVMMRIERDLLNAGASSIPLEFMYSSPPAEVFTGVQGSDDIFHWATHLTNTTNSTMRLYTWQDNSSSIRSIDRIIDNYNASNKFYCASPDNFNWCQTSDHRITGGWKMGDIIGFLWNVPAGGDFPYTYVDAATFNSSDMTYLARPSLWSEDHAWAYAFASPDKDKLGIVAAFGGGNVSKLYPGSAVGIGIPGTNGDVEWNLYYAVNGTNGPVKNEWGDYFRTFAMDVDDNENRWIGTGFVLQGGNSSEFIKPHYFEFGLDN
jgi:hypothetical protein